MSNVHSDFFQNLVFKFPFFDVKTVETKEFAVVAKKVHHSAVVVQHVFLRLLPQKTLLKPTKECLFGFFSEQSNRLLRFFGRKTCRYFKFSKHLLHIYRILRVFKQADQILAEHAVAKFSYSLLCIIFGVRCHKHRNESAILLSFALPFNLSVNFHHLHQGKRTRVWAQRATEKQQVVVSL